MSSHITKHRPGFAAGLTWVTQTDESADNTGIAFGVLKLTAGQRYDCSVVRETALLLMTGSAQVTIDGKTVSVHRDSLFDQAPYCVHLCAGTELAVVSPRGTEFTIYQTDNIEVFDGQIYRPEDVSREQRGKGQVGDTCWREVRTIFDAPLCQGSCRVSYLGKWRDRGRQVSEGWRDTVKISEIKWCGR